MALQLDGLNPLSYMGVAATNPPQLYRSTRQPTANDLANFSVGTIWIFNDGESTTEVYMLTDISEHVATWLQLG